MFSVMSVCSVIELTWSLLGQHVVEFVAHVVLDLLARAHHGGERVAGLERRAGVDDDAGVARVVAAVGHRIERGRPAAAQRLQSLARNAPHSYRPPPLFP